jgi:hypothetical protein
MLNSDVWISKFDVRLKFDVMLNSDVWVSKFDVTTLVLIEICHFDISPFSV